MEMHTPGPWSLQPIGDETECNILGKGRELVATVSDNDARLIAAAPQLLAALQELRAQLRQHVKLDVKKHYSLMVADAAAGTAIDKATNA